MLHMTGETRLVVHSLLLCIFQFICGINASLSSSTAPKSFCSFLIRTATLLRIMSGSAQRPSGSENKIQLLLSGFTKVYFTTIFPSPLCKFVISSHLPFTDREVTELKTDMNIVHVDRWTNCQRKSSSNCVHLDKKCEAQYSALYSVTTQERHHLM